MNETMKVTLTEECSEQVSEDHWRVFTKVYHATPDMTVDEIYARHFRSQRDNPNGINVQLHISWEQKP